MSPLDGFCPLFCPQEKRVRVAESVGKDESLTRNFNRYVCMTEGFLNVESDERIEMEESFDTEEKN